MVRLLKELQVTFVEEVMKCPVLIARQSDAPVQTAA